MVISPTPGDGQSSLPNDPWVLKEGNTFRMWFTRGDPTTDPIHVRVFEASSPDGINWTERDGGPVFGPPDAGPGGSFDDTRTETPAVVKLGNTWHMYYSGCGTTVGGCAGVYHMGHATSADGLQWTRDPLGPVLIPEDGSNPFAWGLFTTAEPGVVVKDGTIFLYYASARADVFLDADGGFITGDAGPIVRNRFGILVATSTDGRNFTTHQGGVRMLALETPPDITRPYSGYSTPAAVLRTDGNVEVYMDLVSSRPNGSFVQVGLARAVSADGLNFGPAQQLDPTVFGVGNGGWTNGEILAPTVVQDGNNRHLWFAGFSELISWETFGGGIGYATEQCVP